MHACPCTCTCAHTWSCGLTAEACVCRGGTVFRRGGACAPVGAGRAARRSGRPHADGEKTDPRSRSGACSLLASLADFVHACMRARALVWRKEGASLRRAIGTILSRAALASLARPSSRSLFLCPCARQGRQAGQSAGRPTGQPTGKPQRCLQFACISSRYHECVYVRASVCVWREGGASSDQGPAPQPPLAPALSPNEARSRG